MDLQTLRVELRKSYETERSELSAKIQAAEDAGLDEQVDILYREKLDLLKKLQELS